MTKYTTIVIRHDDSDLKFTEDDSVLNLKEGMYFMGGIIERVEKYNAIDRLIQVEAKLHEAKQYIYNLGRLQGI